MTTCLESQTCAQRAGLKTALVFICFLSFLPVLAVYAPRFMAYGPAMAGLGLYIWSGLKTKNWRPGSCPALTVTAITVFLAGLSALWSIDSGESLERAIKIAAVLIPAALGYGAIRLIPAEDIKRYILIIPAALALSLGLIYAELLFGMPVYKWLNGLARDAFFNSAAVNRATVTCTACLFMALAVLRTKKLYAEMAALLLLMLLALSLSQSQSAVLGLVCGLPFLFFMPLAKRWVWKGLFVILMALITLAPFIAVSMMGLVDFLESSFLGDFFERSYAAERLEIWSFISKHILSAPWLGYGIEATRNITDFQTSQIYYRSTTVLHPHNFALQIWIEFGMLGIAILCAGLYGLLLNIRQTGHYHLAKMESATLIAMIAMAAVGYGIWQGWWLGLITLLFYFSALIGCAYAQTPVSDQAAP